MKIILLYKKSTKNKKQPYKKNLEFEMVYYTWRIEWNLFTRDVLETQLYQ